MTAGRVAGRRGGASVAAGRGHDDRVPAGWLIGLRAAPGRAGIRGAARDQGGDERGAGVGLRPPQSCGDDAAPPDRGRFRTARAWPRAAAPRARSSWSRRLRRSHAAGERPAGLGVRSEVQSRRVEAEREGGVQRQRAAPPGHPSERVLPASPISSGATVPSSALAQTRAARRCRHSPAPQLQRPKPSRALTTPPGHRSSPGRRADRELAPHGRGPRTGADRAPAVGWPRGPQGGKG
jgi:hypothetical protein